MTVGTRTSARGARAHTGFEHHRSDVIATSSAVRVRSVRAASSSMGTADHGGAHVPSPGSFAAADGRSGDALGGRTGRDRTSRKPCGTVRKEPDRMRTLVLNAGYEPLGIVSDRRALVLVLHGRARVLREAVDDPVVGTSESWSRPTVVILTRYVRVPHARFTPVSRRGVLRRDDHACGYCGAFANTIDHILPRSRGGADSWENLVACCLRCNNVKGDRTPAEMGWSLREKPAAPRPGWTVRGTAHDASEWVEYLPAKRLVAA